MNLLMNTMLKSYLFQKVIKIFFCFVLVIVFLFGVGDIVLAQDANSLLWGNQAGNVQTETGLGNTDPRVIIARIIQIFLGFLGIIAVILIMYGGWLWMSSQGDPQKIDQAKKTLTSAIVGTIIILMAFSIVSFIVGILLGATGGGGGSITTGPGPGIPSSGSGAIGNCIIETVYPVPGQADVPRNINIIVTFKEPMDPTSIRDASGKLITDSVKIFKRGTDSTVFANLVADVSVSVDATNRTFVFNPDNYLGSPSEYIWYTVLLTDNIKKVDGSGAFDDCFENFFEWNFETNNKLDLIPPKVKSVIPAPDNAVDTSVPVPAVPAQGQITVVDVPNVYVPSSFGVVTTPTGKSATVTMNPHCQESGDLLVSISNNATIGRISKGVILLGTASVDGDTVSFGNYLTLKLDNAADYFEDGNSWTVNDVVAEQQADYLIVGSKKYIFGVDVATDLNLSTVAQNIYNALLANTQVVPSYVVGNSFVDLEAFVGGVSGNSIEISTNDPTAFSIISMSGGIDLKENITVNSREDEPRNAVIQINFNESVNPINVSGNAVELVDYLKVKCVSGPNCNAANTNLFVCGADLCVKGEFLVSNIYKTVEFVSSDECAVNSCGDSIYCLPADSRIEVDVSAATLADCVDCDTKSPYTACVSNHCHNPILGIMYPLADFSTGMADGVVDVVGNSLDGDRSGDAEGPVDFYNENSTAPPGPVPLAGAGDSYRWSFFINSKINLEPPVINEIDVDHVHGSTDVPLSDPIMIDFDIPMMSATLNTGSFEKDGVNHKRINLWSASGVGVGYWVSKIGFDDAPPDGKDDWTRAQIEHTSLADFTTYRAQVGSGVKSIYQNCFLPSRGDTPAMCSAGSDTEVSCCGGVPTASDKCPGF